jgi:hypothetical protein
MGKKFLLVGQEISETIQTQLFSWLKTPGTDLPLQ